MNKNIKADIISEYQKTIAILEKQKTLQEYINIGRKLIQNNYLNEAENLFNKLILLYPNVKSLVHDLRRINQMKVLSECKPILFNNKKSLNTDNVLNIESIFKELELIYRLNERVPLKKIANLYSACSQLDKYQNQKFHVLFESSKGKQQSLQWLKENKKFLFVSGTPRSGTSALGRLLNSSDQIALGIERYDWNPGYHPEQFELDTFLDEDDTKYKMRAEKYQLLKQKWGHCLYFGDKRPNFLFSWATSQKNFCSKSVRIITCVTCSCHIDSVAL